MADDINLDLSHLQPPRYVAIEGPIGVGKTTLARKIAQAFNATPLLERAQDNPFLERFYQDQPGSALPTQLSFLFQRAQQLRELARQGEQSFPLVADYLLEKDQLFAQATLDDDELRLYEQAYEQMTLNTPSPDLVIYLQAPVEVLQERIHQRGVRFEQHIHNNYLNQLNDAYTHFFHYYDRAPLLIVNATEIDLVNNDRQLQQLIETMLTTRSGRHYYNPI